ncbi:P-loop containing nucleoside triphosphate hydrolase protein [Amylocystis lapponica]|nr:P-loop containing nucleoside triphosphate hydrolase protein [Amylocystis lapponica]
MAKKKKTQLKPVARGFATTSLPKKVVQPVEEDESSIPDVVESAITQEPEKLPSADAVEVAHDEFDPDRQEEQSLQSLIDRFQDKTEKEVVRTLKAIDQERRFSDTLCHLDLDSAFVDRILALALDLESNEVKRTVDEPEDKAITRFAITYGVLRRLGFSEDRAYDWLHLHCGEDELVYGKTSEIQQSLKHPRTPRTPQALRPATTSRTFTPDRSSKPATSSSKRLISSGRLDATSSVLGREDTKAGQDFSGGHSPSPSSDQSGTGQSSPDRQSPYDDSTAEFVRLKLQISDLTTHRQPGERRDAAFLRSLQERLEDVKNDYLFDEEEAEAQFRIQRERADAAALQSRLRGPDIDAVPDVFDEEDDVGPGGMFEILEAMPATEVTEQGTTLEVRDMALPKHMSGRTPKALLSEVVHKVDRYAAISYAPISGSSRAKRAAVDIRWEGGKTGVWHMEDIACYDMSQAEQYIATVALHSLTYPPMEGFALGGTAATGSQTTFRLLPGAFRDLWDELEKKRRLGDDTINRAIWAKLRAILELKLNVDGKSSNRNVKQLPEVKDSISARNIVQTNDLTRDQLIAGFQARQASTMYQEMLYQRNQLPIARHRDDIIAALETHQVLVLSGETGCGKSTQVPAFILEDQLAQGKNCKIYCTEPRRISAISLAQRVSRELGEPPGAVGTANSIVGYSIRLESNITSRTRLAFVTNGIALRMLEGGSGQGGQGTAFDEITHIVIDEVHERTIESDFLLIVLKSLLQERPDLKVILMSATVDAEKISNYFGGTPIFYVPGRTFPVDVRYLEDAIEFTQWKVTENSPYARRGKDKYYKGKARVEWSEDTVAGDDDDDEADQENVKLEKRYSPSTAATINLLDERVVPYDLIVSLLERICFGDPLYASYSAAILIFMPGMGEIRRLNDLLVDHPSFGSEDYFKLYPLHSMISSENQGAVFDIPPPGIRKIVIATNIAETGITIPDITCVIDSGKQREMRFDEKRQISRLVETFVAKSNAAQRRGRAGRVQAGLCFHLFTKVRHDTRMSEHPDPEMMRLSLSDLALRIKIMKVKLGTSIEDILSRALDPPLAVNIQRAISALVEVRALTPSEEITPMGRLLSKLPTDVHLGKFLLIATLFRCLDPALTVAATLNSKSPFVSPLGLEHEADRAKLSFRIENSDFLTIHNAFASWRQACNNGIARKFCKQYFLSHQNLQQIEELRQQFLGYLVDSSFIQVDKAFVRELSRARYSRGGKARFVPVPQELNANSVNVNIINAALGAGLYPKILAVDPVKGDMRTITNNQPASFHPSSINFRRKAREFGVNHLCYFTLMHSKKLYAWETGPVDDISLLLLCGESEFKLMSDTVYIDRKIRFRIPPKSGIALKILRTQLGSLLSTQLRCKPLVESQVLWNDLAMMVLSKVKPKGEEEYQERVTLVVNRV